MRLTGLGLAAMSVVLASLGACQSILGFEEFEPAATGTGAGGDGAGGGKGGSSTGGDGNGGTGDGSVGEHCTGSEDCSPELTCLYGYCRPSCADDTECAQDSVCLFSEATGGCRLASETCEAQSCENADLVCGIDATCRVACSAENSCDSSTQRCIAGTCVSTVGEGAAAWDCGGVDDGSVACDGADLAVCNVTAPGLARIERCNSGPLCEASLPSDPIYDPENPPECAAGCVADVPYCDGVTLLVCRDDGSGPVGTGEDCATEELCAGSAAADETVCRSPACAGGEARCAGGETELVLQVCEPGRTGFEDQDYCDTGAALACNPGATACFELAIDAKEVTMSDYAAWLQTTPSATQPTGCGWNTSYALDAACLAQTGVPCSGAGCENPVVCADFCDAYAYCAGKGQHLCGRIGGGMNPFDRYDDPGSSEWMNACSAGGQFEWSNGAAPSSGPEECTYDGTQINASYAVGTRANCASPSPGYSSLFDLSGNVEEWEDSCEKAVDAASAVAGDACRTRGGSFASTRDGIRCDAVPASARARNAVLPTLGFRCCG